MARRSPSQAAHSGPGGGEAQAALTATTWSVAGETSRRTRRRRLLSSRVYASLVSGILMAAAVCLPTAAGAPPAAAPAAVAATVTDSQADHYQVERQLVDLLKRLQDKYQQQQQQQQIAAGNPPAGRATNIDRETDSVRGGEDTWPERDRPEDYGYDERQREQQLEAELAYRGTGSNPPPNVVRSPEGRSAYTNRCRGDTRMCMNSYRIGSKRTEPSNSWPEAWPSSRTNTECHLFNK